MKIRLKLLWATASILLACFTGSCNKEINEAIPVPTAATTTDSAAVDPLFWWKQGLTKKGTYRGCPIHFQQIDGQAIWQGDILLSNDDLTPVDSGDNGTNNRANGIGLANDYRRWKQGRIPYVISPALEGQRKKIEWAMVQWEDKTPIRFVARTNEFDYILFKESSRNASFVGRQGGPQLLELAPGLSDYGTMVHELGHALGLVHEHMRADRNTYIDFHPQNLEAGVNPNNFYTISNMPGDVGFDSWQGFDFASIMLYGSFNFAKKHPDGSVRPVLTKKDGTTWHNKSTSAPLTNIISYGDKETVRAMYSYVYLVRQGILYAVTSEGQLSKLGGGWWGARQTIAADGRYIWLLQSGSLWKADRLTGKYGPVGNGNWNAAVGVTGKDPQGNLYAQAGDYLWKIDKYGVHRVLGNSGWKGTKAMHYHNGALYVLWQNVLYKVNTSTGSYVALGTGNWVGATAIATPDLMSTDLYIVANEQLYKVNTTSGKITFLKNGFQNTSAMTGHAGHLYLVSDEKFYKVDVNGNKTLLPGVMSGVTSMGASYILGL